MANTAQIFVYGPVNGMLEEDADGPYLKVTVNQKNTDDVVVKITKLQAIGIAEELRLATNQMKN